MSEWTDELREDVVKRYQAAEPTAENSVEIVKEIAEDIGKTPNGVRMVLTKAGAYIKKDTSTKSTNSTKEKSASTRVSKADAIAALNGAIESTGQEPDEEIISKLTGKAALYFSEVINNAKESD